MPIINNFPPQETVNRKIISAILKKKKNKINITLRNPWTIYASMIIPWYYYTVTETQPLDILKSDESKNLFGVG